MTATYTQDNLAGLARRQLVAIWESQSRLSYCDCLQPKTKPAYIASILSFQEKAAAAGSVDRRDLCQRQVYLDGMPAKVCGASNQFASVRQLAGPVAAEFSWAAAARIVAAGGFFST